jgi:cysteine desulfurase
VDIDIRSSFKDGRAVYLDMQATTPTDPRVTDAMLPYMLHKYGNAHSMSHSFGFESEDAVDEAREHVGRLINAADYDKEVVFTSGATESNNIAIKGVGRFYKSKKNHIITTQTEHKCVLDSCRALQAEGFEVTYLPVLANGLVDVQLLKDSIRPTTVLVSVMMVNNEIGVVQPIAEIGAIVKEHKGCFFHVDGAQAVGKIPVDVQAMNIDLLSVSGHKLYGPKGIGCLYVSRRRPRVRLAQFMSGGGQERNYRSGTLPVPLVVGMGEACRVAEVEMERDAVHVRKLFNRLWTACQEEIEHVALNGDESARYYGNANISFAFVEGESLLMGIKDVAVSSGSACTSASLEPSYVLRALGVSEELAHTSIRFGLGRFTTEEEVEFTIKLLKNHVARLREISVLYEMVQDGIDITQIKWTH